MLLWVKFCFYFSPYEDLLVSNAGASVKLVRSEVPIISDKCTMLNISQLPCFLENICSLCSNTLFRPNYVSGKALSEGGSGRGEGVLAGISGLCVLHQPPHGDQLVETEQEPSAVARVSAAKQNTLTFIRASVAIAQFKESFVCSDSRGKVDFHAI